MPLNLEGPVPNPFNPKTTISFTVVASGRVTLRVFDLAGRHVRTLMDETVVSGRHSIEWDGRNDTGRMVGSGVYFYTLEALGGKETRRMHLIQ
jgi:flagellar hook assembly protein FlgD